MQPVKSAIHDLPYYPVFIELPLNRLIAQISNRDAHKGNKLLAQLDADRESAAEKYEQIRQKLTKFFQWRGCLTPDECVDLAIDRVTRRIAEGVEITTRDPYLYFHGVAINVLREY